MAGPTQQSTFNLVIPPGEEQKTYSPSALALRVQNFRLTSEGTLISIRGPCPYEPDRGQGYFAFGEIHSVFHAGLNGGTKDVLLVRAGSVLYWHAGWSRTYETLKTGLSTDRRANYPDQYVVLNNRIIWTNGIDRAQVISADGSVLPLGFTEVPGAPRVEGPANPNETDSASYYPNSKGYSWPGRIGSVGDVLNGQTGSLLDSVHYYHVQYEDTFGNLSPYSLQSNPLRIYTQQASPTDTNPPVAEERTASEIDALLRQALVRLSGDGPEHAVALRLLRTADARRVPGGPRFLVRFAGKSATVYPDNIEDGALGPEARQNVPVPVFKVMWAHQGRLYIANTTADPGVVRRSEAGFPGTFAEDEYVYPDQGGAEVTAGVSHNGMSLAFTETGVFDVSDIANPVTLVQGIGCVAPRTLRPMPDGSLIWLARDGFYRMGRGGIEPISAPIQDTLDNDVSRARIRTAAAAFDPESGEYRCIVPEAGQSRTSLMLNFDGDSWRRFDFGTLTLSDICTTDDARRYQLVGARASSINHVLVLDHETRNFVAPDRTNSYLSGWIRGDETASTPLHVRTLYLGFVESFNGTCTIKFYKNGSYAPALTISTLKLYAPDLSSDSFGSTCVIGTTAAKVPRLSWRQVPVGLRDCRTWAFEISTEYPASKTGGAVLHLAAFAFDVSAASGGNVRAGRIPRAGD